MCFATRLSTHCFSLVDVSMQSGSKLCCGLRSCCASGLGPARPGEMPHGYQAWGASSNLGAKSNLVMSTQVGRIRLSTSMR